jgi:hypothetical protein
MSQYSFEPAIGNALGGSLNPVRRNPDSENAMLDTHFKMTFTRIPNVTFWCNATNIPSISIGEVEVPNKFISLHVPGSSIRSDNLKVSFQLDENFTNWNEIYTWMQQVVPFEDFYDVRMDTYKKRKAYLIEALKHKVKKLSNRARYILANLDGSVDLRKKTAVQVNDLLVNKKFDMVDGDYKYLIKMPMDSVTQENVESILKEKTNAEQELKKLESTTLETMWLEELAVFEKEYSTYKLKREKIQNGDKGTAVKAKTVKIKKTTV